ncbi:DNA-binding transcriptional regulator BolA [Lamellibrachia satsuma]|nr:DNA-binding transcriptional regulator BolA [Lamellibrachia satsuma]
MACRLARSLLVRGAAHSKFASTMTSEAERPVQAVIKKKLTEHFQPKHLDIVNESYMHKVPKGSELHFRVVVVSDKFQDTPTIQRHRMVNNVLQDELKNLIALSISAKTPDQWQDSDKKVGKSPACRGGAYL